VVGYILRNVDKFSWCLVSKMSNDLYVRGYGTLPKLYTVSPYCFNP